MILLCGLMWGKYAGVRGRNKMGFIMKSYFEIFINSFKWYFKDKIASFETLSSKGLINNKVLNHSFIVNDLVISVWFMFNRPLKSLGPTKLPHELKLESVEKSSLCRMCCSHSAFINHKVISGNFRLYCTTVDCVKVSSIQPADVHSNQTKKEQTNK